MDIFFKVLEDPVSGQSSLKLAGPAWIYFAAAAPMTLVVGVWFIWGRLRLQRKQWHDLEAGIGKEKEA
jgi:hypothetical protein